MPLPQFVTRRGNILQYRRAFPKDVWEVTRSAPFSLSLRTADPREAIRARPEAERIYHRRVDEARAAIAARSSTGPPLTKPAAEGLAIRWFLDALNTAEDFRSNGPHPNLDGAVDDAEWAAAEGRRALAEGDLADEARLARCLRKRAGYSEEPVAEAALVRLLARSAIALNEVQAGRLVADYGVRPKDPLFAAAMAVPSVAAPQLTAAPQTDRRTLAELIASFKADRWPKLARATQLAQGPAFRIAEAALGAETPVAQLDRAAGRRLFDVIQRLPSNMGKRKQLAGMAPMAAIEEAERLGLPRIGPKTINDSYLGHLKALFAWAVREQWMTASPVVRLSVTDPVADADKRPPFGDALPVLLGGPPWNPRDTAGADLGPILYWGPLLGLFMGLRLGEIAALRPDSIGEERGAAVLHVRAGKTASARRTLVVHPQLVRLGFAGMAKARQEQGAEMLFEGEAADTKGNWGRRLGTGFKRIVQERGLGGRGLTFHSLRHDFEDALREAGLHGSPLGAYLAGRSQAGKTEAAYGAGYSTEAKAEAIAKVAYPGLALSTA